MQPRGNHLLYSVSIRLHLNSRFLGAVLIVVVLAVIAIILLIATMVFSVILVRNFGKGLKQACTFGISPGFIEKILTFVSISGEKTKQSTGNH